MPKISEQFRGLIPPLTPEEYQNLKQSLLNEGCRDALVVWGDTILDGHNRFEICTENNIPFSTVGMAFDNDNEAKMWIIKNQFARRNLTPYQRSTLALEMEGVFREQAKERQGIRVDIQEICPESYETGQTRDELGKIAGVSGKTIDKVKRIEEGATEEQKEKLRRGEVSINRVHRELHTMGVMGSSDSPEWYTPNKIVELTLQLFGGKIDTDPCSNSKASPAIPAELLYTQEDNGLLMPWRGRVYMNPPYGSEVEVWIRALTDKYKTGEISEAIVLVPGRIDTGWFQPLYDYLMCNIRGRLRFLNAPHSAPFPSVVVYLGENLRGFVEIFGELGPVMKRVDNNI